MWPKMHLRSAQSAGIVWIPSVVESSDQAAAMLFFFLGFWGIEISKGRKKERMQGGDPNPLVLWVKDEDPAQ